MLAKTLLAITLLLPVASCEVPIGVLQPLTRSDDGVTEPALVGEWGEKDDGETLLKFENSADHAYKLTMTEKDNGSEDAVRFDVHLVRLGGYLFMDATITKMVVKGEEVDGDTYSLPLHLFGRLELNDDTLRIRLLEEGWVKSALESGGAHLRYEKIGKNDVLVTASTEELQEFARNFAADEEAFSFEMKLTRCN